MCPELAPASDYGCGFEISDHIETIADRNDDLATAAPDFTFVA